MCHVHEVHPVLYFNECPWFVRVRSFFAFFSQVLLALKLVPPFLPIIDSRYYITSTNLGQVLK